MSRDKYADKFGHCTDDWRGYDYDQLCYHRALNHTRIQLEKHHISVMMDNLRHPSTMASAVMHRVFTAFNYVDYAVLGVKIIKLLRKLRPKKKA